MNRDRSFKVGLAALVLPFAWLVSGCSIFGSSSHPSTPESKNFQNTLPSATASTTSLLPVPVEVASDIAKIAGGGSVDPVPASRAPSAVPEAPQSAAPAGGSADQTNAAKPVPEPGAGAQTEQDESMPRLRSSRGGRAVTYRVKRGDTLMKISFEKFGDLYRWKEILASNRKKIKSYNVLPVGMVLRIDGVKYVVIQRNGRPYLIRQHDTLVKISSKLYGTPQEWRSLWKNNRQMIHDPNRIYAGFTLYYKDKSKPAINRPPASSN